MKNSKLPADLIEIIWSMHREFWDKAVRIRNRLLKEYDTEVESWQVQEVLAQFNDMTSIEWEEQKEYDTDIVHRLSRQNKSLAKKNSWLQSQNNEIFKKDDFYLRFAEFVDEKFKDTNLNPFFSKAKSIKQEYKKWFACVLLSDCHSDEVITNVESAWAEKFNFEVFQKRLKKLEHNVIQKQLVDKKEDLVLFLLWDMVSWVIHEELYENVEAWKFTYLYKTWIVIWKFIANVSRYFNNVTVYTKSWNHWRLEQEYKYKRPDENYDNLCYVITRSYVQSLENVKFYLDPTFIWVVQIWNLRVWFAHWDQINTDKEFWNLELDVLLIWHKHFAYVEKQMDWTKEMLFIQNWTFNKWNWWVRKKLSICSQAQHQVMFDIEQDYTWEYKVSKTIFVDITTDSEEYNTYWEDIKDEDQFRDDNNLVVQSSFILKVK